MIGVGSEIRGYLIEGVLGQGGMGVVYEARQLALDRKVAFKVLTPRPGMDTSLRERFRREGRLQAEIDHPHIVTVYEAGEIDEGLYLVMRLIRGPTLKEMILSGDLDDARTLQILTDIADALDSAHGAGLIHRDIKPQNILVGEGDFAYLADLGLMKRIDDAGLTRTGAFVGTTSYMAPEQIRGETATNRSDVYALTCVLYECLTRSVPYPKPSDTAMLFAHLNDPPPPVTDKRGDLPAAIDDVIARGMAKDPARRPGTASALVREAARALAPEQAETTRLQRSPPEPEAASTVVEPRRPSAPSEPRTGREQPRPLEDEPTRKAGAARPTAGPPQRTSEPPRAAGRRRRPWLAALLGSAAVGVIIAAAVLGLGDSGGSGGYGQKGLSEGDVVHRIGSILAFSKDGRDERAAGRLKEARANRRETVRRVQALQRQTDLLPNQLRLLEAAARGSLKAVNAYIACGGSDCAPAATRASARAKLRFTRSFNPLAQRYLNRTYGVADF